MDIDDLIFGFIGDQLGVFVDLSAVTTMLTVFATIGSIFLAIVELAFMGAMLTRISHKLKVFEKETLAYIPILRDCYRMRMVGLRPAFGLFFGTTGWIVTAIVSLLALAMTKSLIFSCIIFIAGVLATFYFTYKYYNKFLSLFGFDGALALLSFFTPLIYLFIPGSGLVLETIGMIVAFSNKFDGPDELEHKINHIEQKMNKLESGQNIDQNRFGLAKSKIFGIKGKYAGSSFDIYDGENISIGRDVHRCNIVYDEKYSSISGLHCIIKYSASENAFYVTDQSSNGTFVNGGLKIGRNVTKKVDAGSMLFISDENNTFRLG